MASFILYPIYILQIYSYKNVKKSFTNFISIIFHIHLPVETGSFSTKIPTVEGPEGKDWYNIFLKPFKLCKEDFQHIKSVISLKSAVS